MAKLDPQVAKFIKENDCSEIEAANQLGLNLDELYDDEDDEEDKENEDD